MTRSRGASLAILLAGIALALVENQGTALNADLGWILDFGRELVERGTLPTTNGRSFLEPDHPVVLHEWLACVFFYVIHLHWGAAGLIALKVLCIVGLMAAITASILTVAQGKASALLAVLAAALSVHLSVALLRPQLVAWVFLAFVVFAGLSAKRWAWWACVPLLDLWGNLHGSVLAGVCVLAMLAVGQALEREGKLQPFELIAVPVLAGGALLANPYGPGLLLHTWHHATDPVRMLNAEWAPLIRSGPWLPFEKVAVIAFAATGLLGAVLVPWRRVRLWGLFLVAVASGLSAQRHLRMAPILMAPMVAAILDAGLARVSTSFRERLEEWTPRAALSLAVLLGIVWGTSWSQVFTLQDRTNLNIGSALFAMRANGFQGRIWNDFNYGGTLLWALPESQVSCDGRNVAAYSPELIQRSILLHDEKDPWGVIMRSGAELALLPAQDPLVAHPAPSWQRLYCDPVACLLSSKPELIARAKEGLRLPPQPIGASAFFTLPGRPFLQLTAGPPPRYHEPPRQNEMLFDTTVTSPH